MEEDKINLDASDSGLSALQFARKYRETKPADRKKKPATADEIDCDSLDPSERVCLRRTTCSICYERCADIAVIPCGHMFCRSCFNNMFNPIVPIMVRGRPTTEIAPAPLPLEGKVQTKVATLDLEISKDTPELRRHVQETLLSGTMVQGDHGVNPPRCPICHSLARGYMQVYF